MFFSGSRALFMADPQVLYSAKKNFKTALCVFFRISCHSIWPISHLHTIPLERCAFLYALVKDAPMSFPHLFICSLIEVHRSSSTAHALFFLVFIHRILLHLGLEQFPASKPVHIIAPIGATFLR